jgi:hypothetical protein
MCRLTEGDKVRKVEPLFPGDLFAIRDEGLYSTAFFDLSGEWVPGRFKRKIKKNEPSVLIAVEPGPSRVNIRTLYVLMVDDMGWTAIDESKD